jgi:hypothetical protein
MLLSAQQWMRNSTCHLFNVDLFNCSVQKQGSTPHASRAHNVLVLSHTDAGFQLSIELSYPDMALFCYFSFAVRYANVFSTATRLKLSHSILALLPYLVLCLLFTSLLQIFFHLTKGQVFFLSLI